MAKKALWKKTFLRAWREHAEMTLEDASAEMGITHGQLSKIERGLHPYTQHVLEVGAKLYGCSESDLLDRSPNQAESLLQAAARIVASSKEGRAKS